MESNNTNNTPQEQQGSDFQILDLLAQCLRHWKWFVLSIIVCMGLAAFYLSSKSPVYSRMTSLLIKEQGKGSGLFSSEMENFAQMGVFSSKTNVNNEVVALQSPDLILQVVRRLDLDVNYSTPLPRRLRNHALYGSSLPIKVEFKELSYSQGCSFRARLEADTTITLSGFVVGKDKLKGTEPVQARPGEEVMTPVGKVVVTYSPFYNPEKQVGMEILVSRIGLVGAMRNCKARLQASLSNRQATIIDLTYKDLNIQRAEDFLNTLISAYNENWVRDKNQIAVSTSQFIDERLRVIERELGDVDRNISSYKSENLIPDIQGASQIALQQATTAGQQINSLNNQLYMARYVKDQVGVQGGQFQLLPANSGIVGGLDHLISEFNNKVLQRNSLVANSSAENPLVLDLDRELESLRAAILQSIDNTINDLNKQIQTLRDVESSSTSRLSSNPRQAEYLLSVERQQSVKEALYLFLLQKREENELSQAFTAYNTRTIVSPSGSNIPVAPRKMQILMAAFLLALLIPAAILYMKETLNTKVRGRKDIEKYNAGIPFIGEIPQHEPRPKTFVEKIMPHKLFLKKNKADTSKILVKPRSRSIMNEAFRVVRTNIEFMESTNQGTRIIMFTSINPGSGKTFLSINLAASFAIKGKKVVMLDLDMRRASLSEFVNSPKQGLSDYLSGNLEAWESIKVPVEGYDSLDMLPVGTIPPNPAELLFSPRLQPLLDRLSLQYDMILLDCPPVEIVADASVIARYANLTVFVVRADVLERDMLPEINRYYKAKKFNNLCLLLNGTAAGAHGYGYHRYGYHYGHYGYGYGYGSYGYGSYGGYTKEDDE